MRRINEDLKEVEIIQEEIKITEHDLYIAQIETIMSMVDALRNQGVSKDKDTVLYAVKVLLMLIKD